MSAAIFRAWNCVSYSYDGATELSFLVQDLSVRCGDSAEHQQVVAVAWALVVVWPIGMVLLYAALLAPLGLGSADAGAVLAGPAPEFPFRGVLAVGASPGAF